MTEYDFGAGDHISGGLAQADVLGVLGREGVFLANYWGNGPGNGKLPDYIAAAFRIYRNYDGRGGMFGDTAVKATVPDVTKTSVFAAVDSKHPNLLTVLVINKDQRANYQGHLTLHGATKYGGARVFRFDASSPQIQAGGTVEASRQPHRLRATADDGHPLCLRDTLMGTVKSLSAIALCTLAAIGGTVALVRCMPSGGVAEVLDATATTGGICIGACVPDPGSAPADCSQQDQVDTLMIESFDNFSSGTIGSTAQDLYVYSDGTAQLYFSGYNGITATNGLNPINAASGFEPPVAAPPDAIAACQGTAEGRFVPVCLPHLRRSVPVAGDGGMGVPMAKLNGRDPTRDFAYQESSGNMAADPNAPKDNCCVRNSQGVCTLTDNAKYAAICPPVDAEYAVSIATVDASQYEGVSFWARRGPNGQEGMRVLVGDKYTDDDINYIALRQQAATGEPQPIYCHRNRECACTNHQPCNQKTVAELTAAGNSVPGAPDSLLSVCGLPHGLNFMNSCISNNAECAGANGGPSACCDVSNCDSVYPAYPCDSLPDAGPFVDAGGAPGDIQFFGRPCTPYAWANGVGSSYCYDPNTDPPPWPSTEQCGDFWMTTVDLTTDWQFFKVPFTKLRQQGFAQKSEFFDLHSVSLVRFSWDTGWIDYWVDNVSFYREKGSGGGDP